jgi:uncharacterized protein (TIGR02145 family)
MKRSFISGSLLIFIFSLATASGEGRVKDSDGNVYRTVRIGGQVWMAENLNTSTFRNGDPIPEARTGGEWEKAGIGGQPAWCYYNNDPANAKYGKLYNWYAVNDPRGLAPHGWHVPEDAEWQQLMDHLEGESASGIKLKSSGGWNDNGNGTNESGFNALPGGLRYSWGAFRYTGEYGFWLSSDEHSSKSARSRFLSFRSGSSGRYHLMKGKGYSVRCIMD